MICETELGKYSLLSSAWTIIIIEIFFSPNIKQTRLKHIFHRDEDFREIKASAAKEILRKGVAQI